MIASWLGRAISFALVFLFTGIKSVNCIQIDHYKYILLSDSGTLTSRNEDQRYFPHKSHSTWLIFATQPISFNFVNFDFFDYNASVTIYDGPRESSPILFQITSKSKVFRPSIVSTARQVLVIYQFEDVYESYSHRRYLTGFTATYEIFSCRSELSSESGQFTSPNHPANYPKNTDCRWLIKGNHSIILLFTESNLDPCCDFLTIYDGPTESSAVLLNSTTPSSIKSTTNQILVTLKSGGSGSYSGFKAAYSSYKDQEILSSESSWFPSHEFFRDHTYYRWFIDAKDPIVFSFSKFIYQPYDWLSIYDGPTEFSPVLLKSSSHVPSSVISTSNKILVVYADDDSPGFNVTYSPYRCHRVLTSESGWFASPNFPDDYPNNAKCSWLINGTSLINILLPFFYLQENKDWLMIYDGPTESSPLLSNLSGLIKDQTLMSTGNQVLVVFISDGTQDDDRNMDDDDDDRNDRGVRATPSFNATYSQCRVTSSKSGWLTSPNYPNSIDVPISCWLIDASVPLNLSFESLSIENDELSIYDGPTRSSKLLFKNSEPQSLSFSSTSSQILVAFTSYRSKISSKFNLTYTLRCELIIASESNNWITSPNYPLDYPSDSDYCWVINSTHPIMITFPQFNLEANYDWLRIYDGPTSSSAVLLEASSNYTLPSSIVSTAHQVLVHFKSDSQYSYSGFKVGYSNYFPGITERPKECNQTIHINSTGFILTSIDYPFRYPQIRCNWRFISDPNTAIQISFTDFSTQPEDYVLIFDRENKRGSDNGILLASGINASLPLSCNYISASNWMHVSFNPLSDPSKNQQIPSKMGFHAIVTRRKINECGGDYFDSTGVLLGFQSSAKRLNPGERSPENTIKNGQQLNSTECVFFIQVSVGSQVNLTLSTFYGTLQSSDDSYSLEVYEGHGKFNDTPLVNVTGFFSFDQPLFVVSKTNKLAVIFNDVTKYNKDKCRPREYSNLNLKYEATNSSTYGCYGKMDLNTEKLSPLPVHASELAPKTLLWCNWRVGNLSITSLGDVIVLEKIV